MPTLDIEPIGSVALPISTTSIGSLHAQSILIRVTARGTEVHSSQGRVLTYLHSSWSQHPSRSGPPRSEEYTRNSRKSVRDKI